LNRGVVIMGKSAWLLVVFLLLGTVAASKAAAPPPASTLKPRLREEERKKLEQELKNTTSAMAQQYQLRRFAEALELGQKALAMCERLYPVAEFPRGHPQVAARVYLVGFVLQSMERLADALPYFERALAMNEMLYPATGFKNGHPDLALTLHCVGFVRLALGEPTKALPHLEKALAMREKLYPSSQFPEGHPAVALSLNNMGRVLNAAGEPEKALPFFERALAMRQKLYPPDKFKEGHASLALSLDNMGGVLESLGEPGKALSFHEKALAMYQNLYPSSRFKNGHPDLAIALNNVGHVLISLGEPDRALPLFERALAMRQKHFPPSDFKDGHALLASDWNNVGFALLCLGESGQALPYFEKALAMRQKLYPPGKFEHGHIDLAESLNNMAFALRSLGEFARALPYQAAALAMYEKLYPPERYKVGHPDLALGLNNMGILLKAAGRPEKALTYTEKALAMRQKLYPPDRFKDGHPELALSLSNMGSGLHSLGRETKALTFYEKALAMYRRHTAREIASASESRALAWIASLPRTRDAYLSAALEIPQSASASYLPFWNDRGAVFRLLLRRHESAQVARLKSNEASQKWFQLADVRRRVARLLIQPPKDAEVRDRLLEALETEQRQLERALVKLLPELHEHEELVRLLPADLASKLPAGSVFIDIVRYAHYDKAKLTGHRYIAFVVASDRSVQRVPLGDSTDAVTMNRAVTSWRQSIARRESSTAPPLLRKLMWKKIETALPKNTHTVYLCADGDLARLPFLALPGHTEDTVLLENYALACVPSGLWLLHQLRHPGTPLGPDSKMMTVGGVDFGKAPAGSRAHQSLPGTVREVHRVLDTLGMAHDRNLGGSSATVAAVLEGLPQAAIAHLATHGEFREDELNREYERIEQFHERLRQRQGLQVSEQGTDRVGLAVQNPLGFVGVVLSGGNDQTKAPGGGILTGLQILEQPLQEMRLCVLSACETGLGRYTQGEGVAGLQRAFHVAGCRNVVGSLWKVDDAATAALMAQFYHELWVNKKPPLQALRLAQLTIYRHPERIEALAGMRGRPDRERAVKLGTATSGTAGDKEKRSDPLLWAAFVLSGAGD
jgi:CHAT domain-containing protein/Tfp pilus assembly protein PilF